jgi:hypothetical protein
VARTAAPRRAHRAARATCCNALSQPRAAHGLASDAHARRGTGSACRAALPPSPAGALRPPRAALALPPRRARGCIAPQRACRAARRSAAPLRVRAAAADGSESSPGGEGGAAATTTSAAAPRPSRHATWEGIPPPPLALEIELPPLSRGGADAPYDLVVRWRTLSLFYFVCLVCRGALFVRRGLLADKKCAQMCHATPRLTRARRRRARAAPPRLVSPRRWWAAARRGCAPRSAAPPKA